LEKLLTLEADVIKKVEKLKKAGWENLFDE
jgi:hypothetical protein